MPSKWAIANAVGQTFRDDKLVTRTARYAQQQEDSESHRTGIYPAEMSHSHRCERAIYYRLTDAPAQTVPVSLVMERVFDFGNQTHTWWQDQWWGMGILKGLFKCKGCTLIWEDTSPIECPRCFLARDMLKYLEVPFASEKYGMVGRADADLTTDGLVEVKTLGARGIQFEAPHLAAKHGANLEALWRDINHPFPSHYKQGLLYCYFLERDQITFLYEPKFVSAAPKEFVVKFRKDAIDEILEECLEINDRVAQRKPPRRPQWATRDHATCKRCPYRKHCYPGRK